MVTVLTSETTAFLIFGTSLFIQGPVLSFLLLLSHCRTLFYLKYLPSFVYNLEVFSSDQRAVKRKLVSKELLLFLVFNYAFSFLATIESSFVSRSVSADRFPCFSCLWIVSTVFMAESACWKAVLICVITVSSWTNFVSAAWRWAASACSLATVLFSSCRTDLVVASWLLRLAWTTSERRPYGISITGQFLRYLV